MKMYVGTEWSDRPRTVPVINPFDGSQIDTVPRGNADDVGIAMPSPRAGARKAPATPCRG
jgi:acyl-CoA reductase-like NAD-dependent aldehyde dehydrogenase